MRAVFHDAVGFFEGVPHTHPLAAEVLLKEELVVRLQRLKAKVSLLINKG